VKGDKIGGARSTHETRNAYKILIGKTETNRLLGRSRRRWKVNMRTNVKEIGWEGVNWVHLAQERPVADCCEHVMKLRVP
jgi:hypothetical protein